MAANGYIEKLIDQELSMKISLRVITIIFIFAAGIFAQNPNLGTAGAQFLKIPISARAVALGGAFTAMADDATAVFWNPAGIANIKDNSAHFSYIRWFDMFDVSAASYVHNLGLFGNLGIGVLVFSTEKMEVTTETSPNGTGRFFDAQDMALSLTYSRALTDRFSAGISLKYINQRIWNETANGVAFDVGTQYHLDFQNIVIAMSMFNFGPDLRFAGPDLSVRYDYNTFLQNRLLPSNLETEDYPLPLSFQFGLAFDIYNMQFFTVRGSVDAVHLSDNNELINFGGEVGLYDRLFLRGGYKMTHDDQDYSLGLGVNTFLGSFLMKIDYAYVGYNILPDVHFLSIGFDF
ncbi:MAG: PorV/PorQ family protein [Calditrichales bacterium]|nr:MAG: PorV/PorQ family protein [Calditrichales bacterium]